MFTNYVYFFIGLKPSELYGKYTWKIEKFSEINKRELRSNQFEVGGYKWYEPWNKSFVIFFFMNICEVCMNIRIVWECICIYKHFHICLCTLYVPCLNINTHIWHSYAPGCIIVSEFKWTHLIFFYLISFICLSKFSPLL